jgi:hypothetical protein
MRAVALFPTLLVLLVGCGGPKIVQGTLRGPEMVTAQVPRRPQITLHVPRVIDARPADEHEGATVKTKLFVFFLFGVHIKREGNYITDDFAASPDAAAELHALAVESLAATGTASKVSATSKGDFDLRLTIEHLYGTHFAANKQTIVVVNGRQSTDAVVDIHAHNYASYGNVTLKAELIDRRDGTPKTVWTEHVTGYAQRPAGEARVREVQFAVQLAVSDALSTLSQRVSAALDRLGVGPSGPPMVLSGAGSFPGTFTIERMSRYRDFLERVYVDTATGRVMRHEIMPAPDRYSSRPGDWVLSRITAEGVQLSPEGYQAFARSLAGRYDLRQVDDATHFHFFGVLGTAAPAAVTLP